MNILGFNISRLRRRAAAPASGRPETDGSPRNFARIYAAARTDRLTLDWPTTVTSANAEIDGSRRQIISRSRQQERDNGLLTSALRLFENNVVGPNGVDLQMKVKNSDGTLDKPANSAIETAWFTSGKPQNCTVSRNLSRTMLLYQVIDSVVRDGGILLRKRPNFANPFRYALQPIEIDLLDHDYTIDADQRQNAVRFGIEMDSFGAPVAYHILTKHPGDYYNLDRNARTAFRERVPAMDIIAVWDIRTRAGQVVGMPRFASSLLALNHLEKYDEAELVAARENANSGGWFKKSANPEGGYTGPLDEAGNQISDTAPGKWEELPMGWEPVQRQATHPTDAYDPFTRSQIRKFARGIGLSYMAVSGDLSQTNFSSGRMGRQEDQREFRKLQICVLIEQLLEPWFEDWLPYAIMGGQLFEPGAISKLNRFLAATWQPQGWEWIQPKDDLEANRDAIACGLKSRKQVIAEQGGDIEEVDAENAADRNVFPTGADYSPAYAKPGSAPPMPEPPEKPEPADD